jgi:hypothetical protein
MRSLQVNPGYTQVLMPDGATYKAGDTVLLSDEQYAKLSASAKRTVLTDITGEPSVGSNGLTVPKDWGKHWRAARGKAATQPAVIVVFGDSIGQGIASTVPWNKGWVGLMRDALQARFGDGGSGFLGVVDSPPAQSAGYATRATVAGTWTAHGTDFGVGGTLLFSSSLGATYTEPSVRGRYIDVHTLTAAATGTFEVRINGVLQAQTIDGNAAAGTKVTTYDRGAGNTGPCSVEIRATSATVSYLCGIVGRNASSVIVHNMSKWGEASALALAGSYSGATTANSIGVKSIFDFAPDLFIYAMGGNDHTGAVATSTVRGNVRYALNLAKGAKAGGACDLLYSVSHIAENDAVGNVWDTYVDQIQRVILPMGGAVVNHWARGESYFNYLDEKGYSSVAGNVHPNDAGHAWMAQPVIDLLLGVGP